ncbi:MAG: helix-turn-helix transcriptional regulator [Ruminococcaceae bacterium]|nr:helix-turn-helix transcriptional regulator [Oscillospiraceae bacterium]
MNSAILFENKLEMESFGVSHSHWEKTLVNDFFRGYQQTSFGYIIKGCVELYTHRGHMHLTEGTLFLVPEKMRYRSEWHGSPEIEYISVHSRSRRFTVSGEDYQLQAIPEYSGEQTEALFRQIFSLCESGTRADKTRALGLYCIFFADVLPCLEKTERSRMHPALSDAMTFMSEHFRRDFSMDELAEFCRISVSRLHHLFAEELHTTPLRRRSEMRVEWAVRELIGSGKTIEKIAEEAGFSSAIYFREIFKNITGMTPSAYRSEAIRTKDI